jgi:hypothetical protein
MSSAGSKAKKQSSKQQQCENISHHSKSNCRGRTDSDSSCDESHSDYFSEGDSLEENNSLFSGSYTDKSDYTNDGDDTIDRTETEDSSPNFWGVILKAKNKSVGKMVKLEGVEKKEPVDPNAQSVVVVTKHGNVDKLLLQVRI